MVTIVGYTHNAEQLCVDCARTTAEDKGYELGAVTSPAVYRDINCPYDEHGLPMLTPDDNPFYPIFSTSETQPHGESCGSCLEVFVPAWCDCDDEDHWL